MPGEFDLIHWIRSQHGATARVPVPQGDDLAVVRWNVDDLLLVGVDQVLDGVHFDSAVHSPADIGKKVMNRNLSDCAAMACLPTAAVTTFALPRGVGIDYAKSLYQGMRDAGDAFGCTIVGGDTGSWAGPLAVTVTIPGRSEGITPITRRGARVGDGLFVTGPLGGSILGRHLHFVPRVHLARQLAATGMIHAMIDVSDGLSRDARHLLHDGLGAEIEAMALPIHGDADLLSKKDGRPAIEHALHDGEDHELLFAAPFNFVAANYPGVTRIGRFIDRGGLFLKSSDGSTTPVPAGGWQHEL